MTKFIFLLLLTFCSCRQNDTIFVKKSLIKSCDLSFLPEIRLQNLPTKNLKLQPEDMLQTLKNEGVNTIRLRLWNNPREKHSGFEEVKKFSQEIRNNGLKIWICAHYSDTWADPSAQNKPNAWKNANFDQLKDSVYYFTKKIMTEIKPDFIQIGNEINHGFLQPDGTEPKSMTELLAQGIKAVREQHLQTKIMLHYAGYENANWFFQNLRQLDYDIIAISYYPLWHGKNLQNLEFELNKLGNTFDKDLIIAETSYPFSLQWNDFTNNIIGSADQILADYPASPQGQKNYLNKIKEIITKLPKGIGFSYWGAEWVAFKGKNAKNGSSYENQALWDFELQALPAIEIFND